MNRKAKRNKYRNKIINKDAEINTLKNEIYDCTKAYSSALLEMKSEV